MAVKHLVKGTTDLNSSDIIILCSAAASQLGSSVADKLNGK